MQGQDAWGMTSEGLSTTRHPLAADNTDSLAAVCTERRGEQSSSDPRLQSQAAYVHTLELSLTLEKLLNLCLSFIISKTDILTA